MASVYTNDLRLEEIGTGEQTGTWGNTTNTNLELIAEAFSYSSTGEAIANASTHTITVADGASDEARSLYLKCTGGGQACTVTLAPSSLSKVWIIENQTSYTLTFSQGSGANVAVLAGQVKMIATDGGEGSAAVYDLFQDLAVPDLFVDDDLKLQSDGAVLSFGADGDVSLTHVADTALLLNSSRQLQFGDSASFIQQSSDGVLRIDGEATIDLNASTAVTVSNDLKLDSDSAVLGFGSDNDVTLTHVADTALLLNAGMAIQFRDSAISIRSSADATLDLVADGDMNLTAGVDINIPANVGLTFGDDGEKIEGDGTDLTITGNNINLTATADVNIPSGVGLTFATAEKIESDGTDLSITVGSGGDINIPANIGLTFGDDGEKIEGDGTDLTISGNNINLTATADIIVPANVGITFGTGEKIEGDSTDLTVTSGAKINLTATSDVVIPSGVGLILDGSGDEKIESDGTDINISVGSSGDINIPANIGLTFGDDGEKIEGDGTDLTISGNIINLSPTSTVTVSGVVDITDTTDSSDATGDTGALRTEGGASIAKKLYVGTDLDVDGTTNLDNTDIDGTLVVDGSNISLDSTTTLNIDNSNTSNGITIGTATSGVPISIGHSTSETTINDNLTVTGDLTVSGTTTTVNSTTVNLNDHNIVLDSGNSTSAVINGAGITIEGGSGDDATFSYNTTGPKFELKLGSSHEDLQVDGLISGSLIIADGGNIGSTSDTDAIAIGSDGDVTLTQDLELQHDGATLSFGANDDVVLTHVHDTGLLLNSTMAIQFNDASQFINAPSATVLDINATDEIELNATLVDVNANLDVSGTYTGGGLMTTGGNIVIPDAGNIGSASDTDAIAIASDGQVSLTQDLTVKTTDGAILKLQTSHTTVADGDVLGAIEFSAPDDSAGTDAITVAASIVAEANDTFAADANEADLVFKLGNSGVATEMMRLTESLESANRTELILTHDQAGNLYGPVLTFNRVSSSPANDDKGGQLLWKFENDANETLEWSYIRYVFTNVSDGSEAGKWEFVSRVNGSNADALILTGNSATFGGNLVIADAGNIGSASDTDAIAIASNGVVTLSQGLTSTAASNTLGTTSFNDANITNVGDIALDSITSDGGNAAAITFSQGVVPNTVTEAASGNYTPDMSRYTNFILTVDNSNNCTLQDPTDEVAGQSGIFVFIQDGTGGGTLSHADDRYFVSGGTSITLSTAANAIDIVPYFVQADGKIHLGVAQKAFAEA